MHKQNQYLKQPPERELLANPVNEHPLIASQSQDVLMHWQGPDHDKFEIDTKWYIVAGLIILAITIYALLTNSPIMAITFILIGIVGYMQLKKEPRIVNFLITMDGIMVENEIFEFDNIKSFWIIYEPDVAMYISLKLENSITPNVHIPINNENPNKIRELLLEYLEEEKHNMTFVDRIELMLHSKKE